MSFGGSGGFGGFGSNNNQSTFGSGGGFGSANTNTGFGGAANTTTPFGQANTGTSIFGGGNTGTGSAFGAGGGGFGSNTNTTFGSKPFGGSTGGGLFGGGSTSGSTFGGFGATANNNTAPAFGSGNTGAGIFGQNKTGFGSTTTGTGTTGLFGGGSTGGGFGSTTTNAFGGGATSGFGAGAAGQPPPNNGTASVPFSAFQEKDAGGQQQFQTITFQQPYQHYSLEELRLADYNQGRRYGNSNGQAGAFGQSTGFGGFGSTANTGATGFGANTNANTGGGLFGGSTNTTTLFGQTGTTTSFGSNNNATGGGLFGQNKPAGGLFGNTSTTQPATGGGLFGNTGTNTGTGFGTGGTTGFGSSTTTGGGLFGQQNQTQNKPAFGGFGSGTTTTTPAFGANTGTTGGFGTNTGTGGGLFGQQNQTTTAPAFGGAQPAAGTGGGLFGGGAATGTGTGGGLFGQSQQNQTQAQPAGGLFGGGGFGQNNQQNQQKPGGLFGGSTTTTGGGGLFGQTNQTQPAGGLFGQNQQNQNQGSSLFGNKPATTGGGLFGGSTTNTNTGGGLFGNLSNNTNQQNTGSTLFGNTQNQQKPGGLFGGQSATNTTGGGLFGNQAQNNTSTLGGSLFGGQNQQQQTQQPLNNSLFGASGNSGSLLQTSMNTNPYGNDALFAGLATPTASPGPLATPLSSSQKNRKSAILPQHKLNPSASTRLLTPQNKRAGGYGFTYSTYGTPSSASASSSPNFGSSLFGNGSLSRSLGKSLSTSNLRNSYTPETSILAPGAFSTNGRSTGSSSLKKLNINRSINTRVPLFDEPSTEKKRVSFAQPSDGADRNGADHITPESGALVRTEPEENSRENGVSSSSSTTVNGDAPNGHASEPEMSQVNGKQLTTVSEEPLAPRTSSSLNKQGGTVVDPTPGQYWSKPSMDELRKMNRSELSKVQDFVVGRDRIGEIQFNPGGTVDLTGVDLDKLFGDIVQLNIRNATVYGETTTVPKPARGTGLNHFSRITLGNSWPRNKAGKKDQKHLERLKRVAGTTFEEYRPQTGEWIFTVPHFSSYGLDYEGDVYDDEEEEEEEGEGDSSELSSLPDTPAQHRSSQMTITGTPQKESSASPTESSPDDTFDFIRGQRRRASVPGGYGNEVAYEEDVTDDTMDTTGGESFLGERSVGSLDGQQDADYTEESESESVEDQDMAGPVSAPVRTTEQPSAYPNLPKSILKNSQILRPGLGTPSKGPLVFDDDWANQLQRTISPKKQDRHALRENQSEVLRETDGNIPKFGQSTNGQSIFTRRGLMESLFGDADKSQDSVSKRTGSGFELPYSKRPKTSNDLDELSADDRAFHSCNKPHFCESGTLVYASKGYKSLEDDIYHTVQKPIAGADRDIRFTRLPTFADAARETLAKQKAQTEIVLQDGVPFARLRAGLNPKETPLDFNDLAKAVAIDTPAGANEHQAWQLLSILFDEADELPHDMDREHLEQHKERYRKDKLSAFWESLVSQDAENDAHAATTEEERAIAFLSGHKVENACAALVAGIDLRLATVVAQIGGDLSLRQDMAEQIEEWRRQNVLSEMEESIRVLYELVAGNCAQASGKQNEGRENQARSFSIAERFGLDWRRAFGLRLWYGTLIDEPIELAVAQFADALRDGQETVKPRPWFVEAQADMGWDDPEADNREDILWGILKLYASSKLEIPANVEDVLAPENVSGHPLNTRLSFQLFHLFKSRHDDGLEGENRKVGMPTVRNGQGLRQSFMSSTASSTARDEQTESPLTDLGDKITLTYAASLHTKQHWTTAVWVYMHLSSAAMREHYIRSLLAQYSKSFSLNANDSTYTYLEEELKVPSEWMHAAAALQAKTEGDHFRQTTHLIKAGELEEAHEVLCRSVGPDSIISRDYDALRELLGEFVPSPATSPMDEDSAISHVRRGRLQKEPVPGWSRGGEIYFDFIHLLDLTSHQSSLRVDDELSREIRALLAKLQHGLEAVARDKWEGSGLEERVALTEIAGVVASLVAKNKHPERSRVLKLPLAEDLWLRHTCDLSVNYYKTVMATGK